MKFTSNCIQLSQHVQSPILLQGTVIAIKLTVGDPLSSRLVSISIFLCSEVPLTIKFDYTEFVRELPFLLSVNSMLVGNSPKGSTSGTELIL